MANMLTYDATVRRDLPPGRKVLARGKASSVDLLGSERPADRSLRDDEGASAPLPLYFREMGTFPLIDDSQEVELGRTMQEAREALARIALSLPSPVRELVLEGDDAGPTLGREWPLEDLERFCEKLERADQNALSAKAEKLARRARAEKRRLDRAREALIVANLRLVVHIAKRYANHGMPFLDLIQEGNLGLMRAVEKFEYERGNKFSTYAYWWIKQAIDRALSDKGRLIRLPVHLTEKQKKVNRAVKDLLRELGRTPTPEELADRLRMPLDKVEGVLSLVADAESFESYSTADRDLLQTVEDTQAVSPLEQTRSGELRERVEATLETLDERERQIIRLRFGLGCNAPHTLEEIGRIVGLSRERVRQIEAAVLRRLQGAESLAGLLDTADRT